MTFDNHRSADFAVYIYMTRNYGDSWVKISNGIPPEAGTVHVAKRAAPSPFSKYRGYLKDLAGREPDEVVEQMRGR